MIIPNLIKRKYDELHPYIQIIKKQVDNTLKNYCEENNYNYVSRIKSIESLSEKIESGRYTSWKEIDDIVGATIIAPTLKFEDKIIADLEIFFKIVDIKKRGSSNKSPDIFRFDSTRITCKIKNNIEENNLLNSIIFEIQIKSAFEFAWSVTTHSLTYKTNQPSWERSRISSQLKAIVEQIDFILLGFEKNSELIYKSQDDHLDTITKISIFINNFHENLKIIPDEMLPKDLSRFSDNLYSLIKYSNWYHSNIRQNSNTNSSMFDQVIAILDKELNTLKNFPRSISLLQLFFAILVENKIIDDSLKKYTPLITEELISLYPKLRNHKKKFEIE